MNIYFGIYYENHADDGGARYGVERFEAENLTEAFKETIQFRPVLDVIEPRKFERVVTSLTFPPNPVDYQWAYLPHQQTFRGLGHHPNPDEEALKDQAIVDYGDGIAQDVLIFDAHLALMFLNNAADEWRWHQEGREV